MADRNRFRPFVSSKGPNGPPHEPEPPEGDAELWSAGREQMDSGGGTLQVPKGPPGYDGSEEKPDGEEDDGGPSEWEGRDQDDDDEELDEDEPDWKERGAAAFRSSTDFMDANYRKDLEDSLRAFNNQHAQDSKYNSETFRKRSNLYRPKTRTIIRKNEAALCAALFSNLDLIECAPANPSDQGEIVSAEVMQQVLQERLTVTMPWFQFAIGGLQDGQTQGLVIAHSYWRHTAVDGKNGYRVKEDRPVQELVPRENFRFDPNAPWYDVVNGSPYLIHLFPMYIGDVMERMEHADPKGRKWNRLPRDVVASCVESSDETTRAARANLPQDSSGTPREVTDYDIVWVHRHIHRWKGEDYEFYMLASKYLLTDAEPLVNNVWFGERPYVIGFTVLETHRTNPSSLPTLTRSLQEEANDLDNQTSDNLKFILNKAWFVKRTANVDTSSLIRNTPGRITMVNDPEKDVKEVNWPDLPQSVFEQKNRNDADFDALAGNFNPLQAAQTRNPRESFATLSAVQSPAMMMTEYTLMTYVQTFLLPCLRQLVLLEQYYETDSVLLAIAGQKAKVLQRFGINEVTDAILEKKMSVNVNLGMGATDPSTKMQRLSGALLTFEKLAAKPIPGLDMKEVGKELFALAGYRDAMRFFGDQDPEKAKLMQTIQGLSQKLKVQDIEKRNRHEANVVKLATSREGNIVKLLTAAKEDDHQSRHLLVGHLLEMEKQQQAQEHASSMQAEGAMQGQAAQAQGAAQQQAAQAAAAKTQGGKAA